MSISDDDDDDDDGREVNIVEVDVDNGDDFDGEFRKFWSVFTSSSPSSSISAFLHASLSLSLISLCMLFETVSTCLRGTVFTNPRDIYR